MRYISLFLSLIILFSMDASAQTPIPSAHPVKNVEDKLKKTKKEKEKLTKKLKTIESELSSKRSDLISVAKKIKNNEQTLVQLEKNIKKKQNEQIEIESSLSADKKSISDLILALERVRRIPPEAILAKPDTPLKTAQSTLLLQSILPRIYKRADKLKTDLKRLDILIRELQTNKEHAIKVAKKLKIDKKNLSSLLSQREKIYASTERHIEQQQIELKQISLQAQNLKDLVQKIEKKQKAENKRRKKRQRNAPTPTRTPIPRAGAAQLPVSGIISVGYGKTDEIGAVSQGIKIKSRSNALIVAPMGGVVDYAGHFKGYGKILILKHQKGYHSLIAGLGKIDTVVGRAVAAGEPIGKMPSSTGHGEQQPLYYELRYKGHPVNPSKKISGLR